jgi:hypothetical protein
MEQILIKLLADAGAYGFLLLFIRRSVKPIGRFANGM